MLRKDDKERDRMGTSALELPKTGGSGRRREGLGKGNTNRCRNIH